VIPGRANRLLLAPYQISHKFLHVVATRCREGGGTVGRRYRSTLNEALNAGCTGHAQGYRREGAKPHASAMLDFVRKPELNVVFADTAGTEIPRAAEREEAQLAGDSDPH
jgi:hypothetical protein